MTEKVFKILVEGGIGAGKSTFINYLNSSTFLKEISQSFPEPLAEWQNVQGINLFKLFCENPKRWAYVFESYAMLTMIRYHQLTIPTNKSIKIMERSIYSTKLCFVELLKNYRIIEDPEYIIIDEWFQYLCASEPGLEIDLIVYLRCDAEVNKRRILQRGRVEEKNLTIDYLEGLNKTYENWLSQGKPLIPEAPVLVLDTNKDIAEMTLEFNECLSKIIDYYNKWSSSN